MENKNSSYFIIDAGIRILLLSGESLQVTQFVQKHVLDARIISRLSYKWKTEVLPTLTNSPGFYRIKNSYEIEKVESVSEVILQKQQRCKLLAEGYRFLFWFANQTSEHYGLTESLEINDIAYYLNNKQQYTLAYADAKGITLEQASKQTDFDYQTLSALLIRRKQVLWRFSDTLIKLKDQSQLDSWKEDVLNYAINVGAV